MTLGCMVLVSVLAGQGSAESYGLRWAPAKGQELTYTLHALSHDKESPMEIEASLKQVVSAKNSRGYSLETTNLGALMRVGGQDIRDNRGTQSVMVHSERGAVVKLTLGPNDDENNQWMFAVARTFVSPDKPVAVGSSWQYEYISKGAFAGSRLSYNFVSVSDGIAKVDFTLGGPGRERPELGKGTWMVNAKTGEWQSMTGRFVGLFGAGADGVTLTIKRD